MSATAPGATPWYSDQHITLYLGDAATTLALLPPGSVDCIVTSPPYWRTRDYEGVPEQLGQETTAETYIEALRAVFTAAHRVLADNGTLWLNLGDRYAPHSDARPRPKNLLGLPWRVALALQEDGWLLCNEIVWHKPNAVPESVRDRLSRRHEHLFLLTKQPAYHFDLDPIRQPYTGDRALSRRAHRTANKPNTATGIWPPTSLCSEALGPNLQPTRARHTVAHLKGRNPGTVWDIATRPTRHAHTAAFPIDMPLRCIASGCRPGGTVSDLFSGSGTTGDAALQLGRAYVGIDIVERYHQHALARLPAAAARSNEAQ
ncbi:site-specific DNA-methyltransferase [Streptomyces sp. NPDC050315]|uniref:DNA-methyltransferase n=1 Tax=Streptomyces sp. NPDC050315 TaxID=3155039 RepID=UPI00343646DA